MLAALLMLVCGCAHEKVFVDVHHPEVAVTRDRQILFHGKPIKLKDLPGALERSGVPHDATVPVKVEDLNDLAAVNDLLVYLRLKGYTRAIFVTARHGESSSSLDREPSARAPSRSVAPARAVTPAPAPTPRRAPRLPPSMSRGR